MESKRDLFNFPCLYSLLIPYMMKKKEKKKKKRSKGLYFVKLVKYEDTKQST